MKFAIIGIGKTGQAMACYLMSKGHEVSIWDRKQEKVDYVNQFGIRVTGVVTGLFFPKAEASLENAVRDAQYILVMTTAFGHLPVAKALSGILPHGARIVIFNGNWGALELYSALQQECEEKGILLGETGGMPILSDSDGVGACFLKKIKNSVAFSAIPRKNTAKILGELSEIYPFLTPAANVIETSINNTNPIMHTPITLFNLARAENGEDYSFYGTAASRTALHYVEAADKERVMIAERAGARGESALEILNSFWPEQYDNLYDAIHQNKTYVAGKGPTTLDYRYITEDVPFGIAPLVYLSKSLNVEAPHLETMLNMFNLLFECDFSKEGPALTPELLTQAIM